MLSVFLPHCQEACPERSRRGQDGGCHGRAPAARPLTLSLARKGRGDLKPRGK
jgi:hypothetical protein